MKTECTETKIQFQTLGRHKVEAAFDGGTVTTDGGALLLRETERSRGIIKRFAACFDDGRDPTRVEHTVLELLSQRVYGLCLGYEDLVDHDVLRRDPVLALLCGKLDPSGQSRKRQRDRGAALAGKSTLNRLELTRILPEAKERYCKIRCREWDIEQLFVEFFVEAHEEEPKLIFIDLDLTDIPLHGRQEERFFHGYYEQYCYLPLYIFCGDFLLYALLRPAYIDSAEGLTDTLEQLLGQIRSHWPRTQIVLRADSGFCREEVMSWVEQRQQRGEALDYLFGLARNSRLLELLKPAMGHAERLYKATSEAARCFMEFGYQTQESWSRARRVVGKAEHLDKGPNPRFIVTSLGPEQFDAVGLYEEQYCARGEAENRIKEQQLCLFADRASSSSFLANQLRLYFSAIAYVLMNELRRIALQATELAHAQCSTIRDKLLKIGARVLQSARRIRLMLASAHPWQGLFHTALQRLQLPLRH